MADVNNAGNDVGNDVENESVEEVADDNILMEGFDLFSEGDRPFTRPPRKNTHRPNFPPGFSPFDDARDPDADPVAYPPAVGRPFGDFVVELATGNHPTLQRYVAPYWRRVPKAPWIVKAILVLIGAIASPIYLWVKAVDLWRYLPGWLFYLFYYVAAAEGYLNRGTECMWAIKEGPNTRFTISSQFWYRRGCEGNSEGLAVKGELADKITSGITKGLINTFISLPHNTLHAVILVIFWIGLGVILGDVAYFGWNYITWMWRRRVMPLVWDTFDYEFLRDFIFKPTLDRMELLWTAIWAIFLGFRLHAFRPEDGQGVPLDQINNIFDAIEGGGGADQGDAGGEIGALIPDDDMWMINEIGLNDEMWMNDGGEGPDSSDFEDDIESWMNFGSMVNGFGWNAEQLAAFGWTAADGVPFMQFFSNLQAQVRAIQNQNDNNPDFVPFDPENFILPDAPPDTLAGRVALGWDPILGAWDGYWAGLVAENDAVLFANDFGWDKEQMLGLGWIPHNDGPFMQWYQDLQQRTQELRDANADNPQSAPFDPNTMSLPEFPTDLAGRVALGWNPTMGPFWEHWESLQQQVNIAQPNDNQKEGTFQNNLGLGLKQMFDLGWAPYLGPFMLWWNRQLEQIYNNPEFVPFDPDRALVLPAVKPHDLAGMVALGWSPLSGPFDEYWAGLQAQAQQINQNAPHGWGLEPQDLFDVGWRPSFGPFLPWFRRVQEQYRSLNLYKFGLPDAIPHDPAGVVAIGWEPADGPLNLYWAELQELFENNLGLEARELHDLGWTMNYGPFMSWWEWQVRQITNHPDLVAVDPNNIVLPETMPETLLGKFCLGWNPKLGPFDLYWAGLQAQAKANDQNDGILNNDLGMSGPEMYCLGWTTDLGPFMPWLEEQYNQLVNNPNFIPFDPDTLELPVTMPNTYKLAGMVAVGWKPSLGPFTEYWASLIAVAERAKKEDENNLSQDNIREEVLFEPMDQRELFGQGDNGG